MAGAAIARGPESRVYTPRHRAASELVELIRTLPSDDVRVAADLATNSVVLVGERERIDDFVDTLRILDRPARTLILHYAAIDAGDLDPGAGGSAWQVSADGFRVRSVQADEVGRWSGRSYAARAGRDQDFAGTLRLVEGQTGRLVSGRDLPLERTGFGWLTGRWIGVDGYVPVESGLEARASILADQRVRLGLRAFVEGGRDARSELDRTHAESVLVVEPDTQVVVAAARAEPVGEGAVRRSARSRRDGRESRALIVRVEVVPDEAIDGDPPPE